MKTNRQHREDIATLRRRADRLEERLADYHGRSDSWTRAELRATRWALQIIGAAAEEELLIEFGARPVDWEAILRRPVVDNEELARGVGLPGGPLAVRGPENAPERL